ncbi:RDD family protein [Niabella hirudinis]|uniref:RDD family protein n=1 Tax=Niabella hirudinis TaxID=1285929 RepID=UPI003EB80EDE
METNDPKYHNDTDPERFSNSGSDLFHDLLPVRYAGFWERFAAALIDGIVLGIIGSYVNRFTGLSANWYNMQDGGSAASGYLAYYNSAGGWINLIIGWLYEAIMLAGTSQATLGKMALGIKVTNLDGKPISFLAATGRHFAKFISAIILLIGYLMMIWDNRKQTLHDKLAGTLVVKK